MYLSHPSSSVDIRIDLDISRISITALTNLRTLLGVFWLFYHDI